MAIGVLLNLLLFKTIFKVFIIFEEFFLDRFLGSKRSTYTRVNMVTKDVIL